MLQKLFSFLLHSKRLAKNPLFEVISLHGPTGPPIIWVLISGMLDTIMTANGSVKITTND